MESPQCLLFFVGALFAALSLASAASAATDAPSGSGLHPLVLLPGFTCSQFDARLTDEYMPPTPGCGVQKQGRGWFRLWENFTALQTDPALLPCYQDQLRLVFDPVADDYRNLPGVQTRVVSFGTSRSFRFDDPAQKNNCMARLVDTLEAVGYKEGANLFGAPYDFRYVPAPPGVPAKVFSKFRSSLKHLVERASESNGNKPVILVTHSFGGFNAMEFLHQTSLQWRRRYVKHFFMLCLGVGGSASGMLAVASSSNTGNPSTLLASVMAFGNRTFASIFSLLPSPKVYGDTPLMITPAKNYSGSAEDIVEFLAATGFSDDDIERYRTRALPLTLNFWAPLVPMTSINGVGVPTADKVIYGDGNFSATPQVVNGDGDGVINLETVLALKKFIGDDPDQPYFKSILIPNMTHNAMISEEYALKRASSSGLHPVILLPGFTCSQLDARLTDEYKPPTAACGVHKQRRGWFRLWENFTALQAHPTLLPCVEDQLRQVFDPVAGDYRNQPGVETRVVSFGTTRSFRFDDPAQKDICMARLADALEGVGYKEGANLFGAPYDFRYAPAAPGVPARVFSEFHASLRRLVERASEKNGNAPVILVSHSLGGFYAMEFLHRTPLPWRRRFVRHFVMLCNGVGGSPLILQVLASNVGNPSSVLSATNRTFETTFSLLPSSKVFGDTPLVITPAKNYSAENIPEFLAAAGFSGEEIERYRTRAMPLTLNFRAPLVPMTTINGVGVPTIEKVIYKDGNFSGKPEVVNGDGDGLISLETVLPFKRFIGDEPDQPYFKSILIPNTTHNAMISEESALKHVVREILRAN
ncbi:hypothetical protein U9M48_029101 [Paspalum notatum var. saurae]|uniref:Lecithin-cholesterol acyltransferase-like 1 n=1 Tax=Paspalum notatum var. saurae TaxID=547442 RepID=A0AAQ3U097_PASNO